MILSLLKAIIFKNKLIEITFFITEKCNMKCKHCFNNKKNRRLKELSLDEIKKIKTGKLLRIIISGGEPFMRNDFSDIILSLIKNSNPKFLTIPTNGYMTKKIINDIKKIASNSKHTIIEIKFSLDQIGDERDKITGVDDGFDKLKQTIKEINKLKNCYNNIKTGVIITAFENNINALDQIASFASKDLNVDLISLGIARKSENFTPNIDHKKFTRSLIKHYKKNERNRSFLYKIIGKITLYRIYNELLLLNNKRKYFPCYSGKLRSVMDPFGNVYQCELRGYPYSEEQKFGNIRNHNYDLTKVLKSKDLTMITQKEKCMCNHGCDNNINILFNPILIIKTLFIPKKILYKKIQELIK